MPQHRKAIGLMIAAAAGLAITAPALAAGGGGGGGSMEAPRQYDPTQDYQKGIAAYQAQDFKGAASAFKRVTGGVPRFAPAQYLLGSSYMQLGDFQKARRPLEAAVRIDPTLVDARRDLGVTYARLGDTAKAAQQRQALAAMKTGCAAPCATAASLDAALQAIDAATTATPPQALAPARPLGSPASAQAVYVAAVGLINEGRYETAIADLHEALWSAGPHPDLLTYLGFANRKLRRYDAARAWYEDALAIARDHRGAIEYYGELKLELGDVQGARRHLARLDALCGFGCQQADELRRWLREAAKSAS